jgi:hypothetical protein
MMIIMFNLIVAIFTDTYDEMKENERAIELKMLNEVIRELENWHRHWSDPDNEPSHLVYVEYELRPYVNWAGKVEATHKTVASSLEALGDSVEQKLEEMERRFNLQLD